MNEHLIIGHIGNIYKKEKVVNMTIATVESIKRDNNWEKETQWHNVVVFYPNLIKKASYMEKGDKVLLRGPHKYSKYIDKKDGIEKQSSQIVASMIEVLWKKKTGDAATDYTQPTDDDPF